MREDYEALAKIFEYPRRDYKGYIKGIYQTPLREKIPPEALNQGSLGRKPTNLPKPSLEWNNNYPNLTKGSLIIQKPIGGSKPIPSS